METGTETTHQVCGNLQGFLVPSQVNKASSLAFLDIPFHGKICRWQFFTVTLRDFPGGSDGKESVCNAGYLGSISGLGKSPEEGNATHSSILAWRISWTEEPSG